MKLKYYRQQQWEQAFIDEALKIVRDMYNKYYRDNSLVTNSTQDHDKSNFFGLFEIGNDSSDENELEEYLQKPVVNFKTNPLQWWKVSKFLA
jgi:hypothetical protein